MERTDPFFSDAVSILDDKLADIDFGQQSLSKELLLGGASAICIKLSEEFAEVIAAFFSEDDEALMDEAQSVIWLTALGLRANGSELAPAVQGAVFRPLVEQKGDAINDAIRSFGDAKGRFITSVFTEEDDVSETASSFIGALANLLELRGITMQQVYERL